MDTNTATPVTDFRAAHDGPGHDVRMMYRTDGTNGRYLYCRKCNETVDIPQSTGDPR